MNDDIYTTGRITAETNYSYEVFKNGLFIGYCFDEPIESMKFRTAERAAEQAKLWLADRWDEEMRLAVG